MVHYGKLVVVYINLYTFHGIVEVITGTTLNLATLLLSPDPKLCSLHGKMTKPGRGPQNSMS